MKKNSFGDRLFYYGILGSLCTLSVCAVIPLLSVISVSLSSKAAADTNQVSVWPVGFTLDSWNYIIYRDDLWKSFGITVMVTLVGTLFSLFVTALLAYPLSKKEFMLTKIIMIAAIVTMVFRAPIVPYFLTLRNIGLYNNILVLIVPHVLSAFNLAIMRTFFMQIPAELEESAVIEGCGYFQLLFRIALPSSKTVLATLGLFYGVGFWNQFWHPLMFLQDVDLFPLQLKIRQFIVNTTDELPMLVDESTNKINYSSRTLRAVTIVFATIPIAMAYPYLQKYFVKGAMLGAVKA